MTYRLIVLTTICSFNKISFTVFNLQSGHEIALTYVPRGIIWKIYKQELWLFCAWHVVSMCFTNVCSFIEISCNGYQVIERTRFCDRKTHLMLSRRNYLKNITMQELWFLCMTCRLNVLYKCMKFHWNICNGVSSYRADTILWHLLMLQGNTIYEYIHMQ